MNLHERAEALTNELVDLSQYKGVELDELLGRVTSHLQAVGHSRGVVKAMVNIQRELKDPSKDQTAGKGSYSYTYANLASFFPALRALAAENECIIMARADVYEGKWGMVAKLVHADGSELFGFSPFAEGPKDAKAQGALESYHRRYAYYALFGLAPNDNEDELDASPAPPARNDSNKSVHVNRNEDIKRALTGLDIPEDKRVPVLRSYLKANGAPDAMSINVERFQKMIAEFIPNRRDEIAAHYGAMGS